MSDFMAVVPLFCKDLGASLYKPFLLNFTPFLFARRSLLYLVTSALQKVRLSFSYTQFLLLILFSPFYQTCTFVIFCLLNSLFSLNKPFWFIMISCFFLSFQVLCLYRIIVPTSPEETIFMAQVGRNLQEKQAILLIKLYPSTPAYKFPPLSNN